jgi:hypothetical protein
VVRTSQEFFAIGEGRGATLAEGTGVEYCERSPSGAELPFDKIQGLSPMDVGQTRWLMYEQGTTSISLPMLSVLVFWLTTLFISFGLFAPRNGTVVASLFISALSVSGAILMIFEMYTPYSGLVQVSSAPLRAALAHLGQ